MLQIYPDFGAIMCAAFLQLSFIYERSLALEFKYLPTIAFIFKYFPAIAILFKHNFSLVCSCVLNMKTIEEIDGVLRDCVGTCVYNVEYEALVCRIFEKEVLRGQVAHVLIPCCY